MIFPFNDTILLWCLGGGKFVRNFILFAKIRKNGILKFFSMITLILTHLSMLQFFSFFNLMHKFLKESNVSNFSLKKHTQVNLKKSSTQTKMYLLPIILSNCIEPTRSICKNSNTLEVEVCCTNL